MDRRRLAPLAAHDGPRKDVKNMMKAIGLGVLAICLVGTLAPLAAANVTVNLVDLNGDSDCADRGESVTIPTPTQPFDTPCHRLP